MQDTSVLENNAFPISFRYEWSKKFVTEMHKAKMRQVSIFNFSVSLLVAVFCGMQVKHSLCKAPQTLNSHEETYNYLND